VSETWRVAFSQAGSVSSTSQIRLGALSRLSFPPLFSLGNRFSKSLVSERMDQVASTANRGVEKGDIMGQIAFIASLFGVAV